MSQHLILLFFCFGNKGWSWSASWNPNNSCVGQRSSIFQLNARENQLQTPYVGNGLDVFIIAFPALHMDGPGWNDGWTNLLFQIPQDIQGWDALQSRVLVSQKSKHFLTPKKYREILSALPTSLPYPSNAKSTTSVGKSHPFIEDLPLKIMEKPSLMWTFPYIFLRFSSIFCRCSPLPSGKLT